MRRFFVLFFALFLFISCDFDTLFNPDFDEGAKEYLEYWSNTCQVAKIEYLSDNVEIGGVANLSASGEIEIEITAINPKEYRLLSRTGKSCFSLQNEAGNLSYSDYSETLVDSSLIKIRARLGDESEGENITLSGCLWPENRVSFAEETLRSQNPELFCSATFIQNTPPDNIKNLNVPKETFSGTNKHYVSFKIPDQSLKRNKDSTYQISYYLRENGSLNYKGTETLSISDNKGSSPTFLYYFGGQEDNLFYEYTVQVIGPHGLKSEIYSTIPGLGVNELNEATITVDGLNGLKDEDDYECVEVENENAVVSFTATKASDEETLTVTVDGTQVSSGSYTVNGIGQHTIVAKSSKDGSRPITVTKKIRIVTAQKEPEYDVQGGLKVTEETSGDTYIEAEADTEVSYTITAEIGCTLTVKNSLGNTTAESSENTHTLTLESLNSDNSKVNNLTVIVKKQYCTDKTFTKKVTLVKAIQETAIRVYKNSGNDVITASSSAPEESGYGDYTCYDLPLTTSGTGNANFEVTAGSGESVSVKIDGSPATASNGKYTLSLGPHSVTLTVTKPNCTAKTFEKKVYIQGTLSDPTINYTGSQDGTDTSGNPIYKFSYLTYDEMPVTVTAGNTGNTVSVKVDETTKAASGFSLAPDSTYTISVVQSRQYCKTTSAYERTVAVKIKPVTVTSGQASMYCDFGDAGSTNEMYGDIYLGKNNSYEKIRNFSDTDFKQYQWDNFVSTSKTFYLSNTSDYICYKSDGMYEKDVTNKDWCANASGTISLSTLKTKTSPFTYEIWGSGSNRIGLKIVLYFSD